MRQAIAVSVVHRRVSSGGEGGIHCSLYCLVDTERHTTPVSSGIGTYHIEYFNTRFADLTVALGETLAHLVLTFRFYRELWFEHGEGGVKWVGAETAEAGRDAGGEGLEEGLEAEVSSYKEELRHLRWPPPATN